MTLRSAEVWKRAAVGTLPFLLLLAAALVLMRARDRDRDRELVLERSRERTRLQAEFLGRELAVLQSSLAYFAGQELLLDFLDGRASRDQIESEYVRFCVANGDLDQMRLLGIEGREVVRVNYAGGEPVVVSSSELQSKAGRYYFSRSIRLPRGGVYVSAFDLNQEHGLVEVPWKPVVRFATPVFDRAGERRGLLVLNCLTDRMLARMAEEAEPPSWTGAVSSSGYYLRGPKRSDSWRFLFGDAPTFAADHPAAWERLREAAEGGAYAGERGIYTWEVVRFGGGSGVDERSLRIVSFVPSNLVHGPSSELFRRLLLGTGALSLVLVAAAVRLAFVDAVRRAHEGEIAASEARLRVLSRRLLEAQEAERRSLARDLHDELGQIATALAIDLDRARASDSAEEREELLGLAQEANARLLAEVHELTTRLRSTALDDLGLDAALRGLVAEQERAHGWEVDVEIDVDEDALPPGLAENVYRIVQEALTNVARHARTEEVSIRIWHSNESLEVFVRDGGVGFDVEAASERHGLLGMRERAELLGGRLTVRSQVGRGTVVEASLPLAEEGSA